MRCISWPFRPGARQRRTRSPEWPASADPEHPPAPGPEAPPAPEPGSRTARQRRTRTARQRRGAECPASAPEPACRADATRSRFRTFVRPGMPSRLLPLDLLDLVGLGAAGRVHLDGFALLLVDQRARDRRGDRNPPLLG